jgi:hypothetical protein
MSQHTPSPWFAVHYATHWDVQTGPNYGDTNVLESDPEMGTGVKTPEEAEANACLMAASPKLFAALHSSLAELRTYRCDVSDMEGPENVDALDKAIQEAEAALAAAAPTADRTEDKP